MTAGHDERLETIDRAAAIFERVAKDTHVLEALQWPRSVEDAFFAARCKELPKPVYDVDRTKATNNAIACDELAMTLDVGDPVQHWLTQVARSYAEANRLLLAIGTRRFHALSRDVYGAPSSPFDHDTTNLDLARHLEERLVGERARTKPSEHRLPAEEFAARIEHRSKDIGLEVEVVLDDDLSAKVLAGMKRVRVRSGATFEPIEVEGLFVHEVETHALTAQNGAAQTRLPFLRSGGPRTTRTQEGLAVFAEFWAHALDVERMRRIVRRVQLIAQAEEGASFLDLFRSLRETGATDRDAYLDAQRICRGGLVEGGAPFTKDSAYLAGFTEVFNFLQVAVRGGAREAFELLAVGRIALDDLATLHELREIGVLEPPKYVPRWISRWKGLLPFFAFASFLQEIDLGQVEKKHQTILAAFHG